MEKHVRFMNATFNTEEEKTNELFWNLGKSNHNFYFSLLTLQKKLKINKKLSIINVLLNFINKINA